MTYGDFSARDRAAMRRRRRPHTSLSRVFSCAVGLVLSVSAGLVLLQAAAPDGPARIEASFPRFERRAHFNRPGAVAHLAVASVAGLPRKPAPWLDPAFTAPVVTSGYGPVTFSRSVPLRSGFEPRAMAALAVEPKADPPLLVAPLVVAESVPLPTPRPALFSSPEEAMPRASRRMAQQTPRPPDPGSPPAPTFFDRLFRPAAPPNAPNTVLAYAAPEDGGLLGPLRSTDRWTAVYDIAAHTVTLPDGTRLEAHSGLGARLDDPRGVTEHMRGATPPNVYELSPREALFHGVPALRLNPLGGTTYGRAGLLAHTYMLGPRGDSNGCVVFRDYKTFRRAYDTGMVKRLMVVARSS